MKTKIASGNCRSKVAWGLMASAVAPRRFNTLLVGTFASLALLLAAVGIYGVLSYLVSQRAHEIGIRMALGARKGDVLRTVLASGMSLAATGVVIGVAGAFALSRVLTNLLYGVGTTDPLTFAAVPVFLLAVSFVACYVPARRAAGVDPLEGEAAEDSPPSKTAKAIYGCYDLVKKLKAAEAESEFQVEKLLAASQE